jgi:hypothetical protein
MKSRLAKVCALVFGIACGWGVAGAGNQIGPGGGGDPCVAACMHTHCPNGCSQQQYYACVLECR